MGHSHAVCQYVEFGGLEDDEESEGIPINGNGDALGLRLPNPNADKANAQTGKSLEVLLVTKNKRIQEELTKFRVSAPSSHTRLHPLTILPGRYSTASSRRP